MSQMSATRAFRLIAKAVFNVHGIDDSRYETSRQRVLHYVTAVYAKNETPTVLLYHDYGSKLIEALQIVHKIAYQAIPYSELIAARNDLAQPPAGATADAIDDMYSRTEPDFLDTAHLAD